MNLEHVNPQEGDWPAQEGKSAQGLILGHSRPRFLPILLGQGRGHQRRTPVHITLESVSALLVGWVAPWVEPWTWVEGQVLLLSCCVILGNKVPIWASVFLSANMRGCTRCFLKPGPSSSNILRNCEMPFDQSKPPTPPPQAPDP